MASRKAAAKEAEDLQGVFIQMDRPAWEGFWGYQDLKKPDYDRFSQDEPVQEAFSQEVLTQRKENEVFNNLTACLEDLGTFEPGQLFKYGKDKVYVQMDEPSEGLRMASALRRHGFAVKRMRTSGWLVKEARTRVRATKKGDYVLREGKQELGRFSTRKIAERHQEVHEFSPRTAAAPGAMTVEMPDPMAAMKTQFGSQAKITPGQPGMVKVEVPQAQSNKLLNPAVTPGGAAGGTGLNKQVPSSTISSRRNAYNPQQTADQLKAVFDGMAGGAAQGANDKQVEYAKRILAGESPEQVMGGSFKPGGGAWNAVLAKVQELRAQQKPAAAAQPAAQPAAGNSLSAFANTITDINWHTLYNTFSRQYQGNPKDPKVQQLGQALMQAATSKNMSGLQPFLGQARVSSKEVEAGPKVELTPEQYGKELSTNVDNYEGYILDNALETKGMPIQDAWVKSWMAMKRAFPGLDQSDKKYVMRKWKTARRMNASASKRMAADDGYGVKYQSPVEDIDTVVDFLKGYGFQPHKWDYDGTFILHEVDHEEAEKCLKEAGMPFKKV
jgi:hypothetical protein